MKSKKDGCWIHQGHNLRAFREAKGMTLDGMAREAGISVEDAFRLEMSRVIDAEVLEKLSKILGVSMECLRDTQEAIPIYETVTNYVNHFSTNGVVNGVQEPGGSHWEDMNFYANPVVHPADKIIELYERLIKSKEEEIEKKRADLERCREKVGEMENLLWQVKTRLKESERRIEELEQKLSEATGE